MVQAQNVQGFVEALVDGRHNRQQSPQGFDELGQGGGAVKALQQFVTGQGNAIVLQQCVERTAQRGARVDVHKGHRMTVGHGAVFDIGSDDHAGRTDQLAGQLQGDWLVYADAQLKGNMGVDSVLIRAANVAGP